VSQNDNQQNFFDPRTIIAVVIVAAVFMGWQFYMQKKYPQAFAPKDTVTTQTDEAGKKVAPAPGTPAAQAAKAQGGSDVNSPAKAPEVPAQTPREEKLTHFENDDLSFDISSHGMGLRNYRIKKFKDRAGETVHLGYSGANAHPFETRLLGHQEALDFDIQKINDNMFVGRAQVGGLTVTKSLEVQSDKYLILTKISTEGSDDRFIGLTTVLSEDVEPPGQSSFLLPQFDLQEFYMNYEDTNERYVFPEEDEQKTWNKVRLASVGSQYFTQALLDKSPIMPEAKAQVNHSGKFAQLMLNYPVLNKANGIQLEYMSFMGPKSHDILTALDPVMAETVNFGWFNWIARQILAMLRWFYEICGNWGVAIILLTIVVRILVLPFNVYSYKSMKAMQVIQPKIQALRERYKDDQQKQQQEMMALMRENKVNPLGGCLPVLLQFPIFIALYQVLGNSIELYQAPFGLWIHDLSLKDPFYILPVLMGVTMFIQQKITPNTMDPAQARIMLMMPLIFTFFMVTLPSGLTLYMWIGAVFSVLQQLWFMREKKPVQTAAA
jgi:YidC/Oxa1 family membrane protein insertase